MTTQLLRGDAWGIRGWGIRDRLMRLRQPAKRRGGADIPAEENHPVCAFGASTPPWKGGESEGECIHSPPLLRCGGVARCAGVVLISPPRRTTPSAPLAHPPLLGKEGSRRGVRSFDSPPQMWRGGAKRRSGVDVPAEENHPVCAFGASTPPYQGGESEGVHSFDFPPQMWRGGAKRRGGVDIPAEENHPVCAFGASTPPYQGGESEGSKVMRFPSSDVEGWREAPGWC